MNTSKPFYLRPRIVAVILLGAALLLFAVQNAAAVELKFGPFVFSGRRFMVIGFSFLTGFLIATAISWRRRFEKS